MLTLEHLNKFCAKSNDSRHFLASPFVFGGMTYASNGHIAIISNQNHSGAALANPEQIKTAQRVIRMLSENSFNPPTDPSGYPLGATFGVHCTTCNGTGYVLSNDFCELCDGDGKLFTSSGKEVECPECENELHPAQASDTGAKTCPVCTDGIARTFRAPCRIQSHSFDSDYIELILSLPGITLSTGISQEPCALPVAKFTFDGGEGLLMPRKE
jgi:hypothetical protein